MTFGDGEEDETVTARADSGSEEQVSGCIPSANADVDITNGSSLKRALARLPRDKDGRQVFCLLCTWH